MYKPDNDHHSMTGWSELFDEDLYPWVHKQYRHHWKFPYLEGGWCPWWQLSKKWKNSLVLSGMAWYQKNGIRAERNAAETLIRKNEENNSIKKVAVACKENTCADVFMPLWI